MLPDGQQGLLEALTHAPLAWSYENALIASGHHPFAILEAECAGMVEPWDLPDGRAWTLTPLAAERLGVEVCDGEHESRPRWVKSAEVPPCVRMPRNRGFVELRFPELVIDPTPGPAVLIDDWSGEPVILWGRPIPRERGRRSPA